MKKDRHMSLQEHLGYKKIRFIVSEHSGKPRTRRRWERGFGRVERYLKNNNIISDREYTEEKGHTSKLVQKAHDDSIGLVIFVGGDGTVNEGLQQVVALGDQSPEISAVPAGRENIFARALGVSRFPVRAIKGIVWGDRQPIDVGVVRNGNETYVFGANAGFGTDAETTRRVQESGKKGRLDFTQSALQARREYQPQKMKVVARDGQGTPLDSRDMDQARVVIINNVGDYAGLFRLTNSDNRDQQLEMAAFVRQEKELAKLFGAVAPVALLRRWLHFLDKIAVPYIETMQGSSFTVESDSPVPFHTDGEFQGVIPSGSEIGTETVIWRGPKRKRRRKPKTTLSTAQ